MSSSRSSYDQPLISNLIQYYVFLGGYSPTLLGFFILLLIINFVLIAGIVFLLRQNRGLKRSTPHVELTDMKSALDQEKPVGEQVYFIL